MNKERFIKDLDYLLDDLWDMYDDKRGVFPGYEDNTKELQDLYNDLNDNFATLSNLSNQASLTLLYNKNSLNKDDLRELVKPLFLAHKKGDLKEHVKTNNLDIQELLVDLQNLRHTQLQEYTPFLKQKVQGVIHTASGVFKTHIEEPFKKHVIESQNRLVESDYRSDRGIYTQLDTNALRSSIQASQSVLKLQEYNNPQIDIEALRKPLERPGATLELQGYNNPPLDTTALRNAIQGSQSVLEEQSKTELTPLNYMIKRKGVLEEQHSKHVETPDFIEDMKQNVSPNTIRSMRKQWAGVSRVNSLTDKDHENFVKYLQTYLPRSINRQKNELETVKNDHFAFRKYLEQTNYILRSNVGQTTLEEVQSSTDIKDNYDDIKKDLYVDLAKHTVKQVFSEQTEKQQEAWKQYVDEDIVAILLSEYFNPKGLMSFYNVRNDVLEIIAEYWDKYKREATAELAKHHAKGGYIKTREELEQMIKDHPNVKRSGPDVTDPNTFYIPIDEE